MLNNLSIRRKLALVALGPLVLLLVLSGLRIRGDLNDSSDATDTQARATVSALTGQLFEAVRAESVENQNAVAIRGLDLDEVRADTDDAISRWNDSVGEFGSIDGGSLSSLVADFNEHRAEVAAEFATGDGAQAVFDADSAVLRTIAAFDGLLARGADVTAVDLRQAADLTTVSTAAAELQLLGMWSANANVVPDQLPVAVGAAHDAAASFGLRNGTELPIGEGSYETIVEEFRGLAPGAALGVSANDWRAASDARAAQLSTARAGEVAAASTAALAAQNDAQSAMRSAGLLALLGLVTAIAAVMLVAKSLLDPLRILREEAAQLAEQDLPQLADSLSSGSPVADVEVERSIDQLGDDEFGQVAAGLIAIRKSAEGLGDHVASLQSGIADTYVNLARRNQSLVDRQLEAIDTLEAEERDSDRLALMYRVDHLATRMRRNAESLLVLADAKTPERRSPAVELREVLRVAIGEVEDYRRIIPIALDDLHVAGHRAQDLAHLLAELMENAAQHSPPGTAVDVSGGFESSSGNYVITILDHGTGIDPDQRTELNHLLSTPPASTLTISHSIGLHVVSRLAHSLGLDVALDHGEGGGLVASVTIPSNVVAEWAHTAPAASTLPPMTTAPAPTAPIPVAEVFQAPVPTAPGQAEPADTGVPTGYDAPESLVSLDVPEAPVVPTIDMPDLDLPSFGIEEQVDVPPAPEPAAQFDVFGNVVEENPPSVPQPAAEATAVFSSIEEPAAAPIPEDTTQGSFDASGPASIPEPAPPVVSPPSPPTPTPEVFAPLYDVNAPHAGDTVESKPVAPTPPQTAAPSPAASAGPPIVPVGAPQLHPNPSPASTLAPVAESAAPTSGVTAAGLVKRQRQSASSIPEVDLEADRTAPSQRTPDQVKNMLSRYKIGLERGRGAAGTDGE